ncbi:muramidase family protein [Latilactobacillus graminis]|uniref:Peptidoglycan hydrolase n=2 Tax=Latilactobacillus graminis TaxID=60519 RepID=A0AA89KWI0_9LACO|nr:LysM peptidoglycan-binding domain-containing protein [Latilactobacillus graminis]KRM21087.1 muramidase-2 domain protein [Latilactobacillus graminis DSM 20719]QFP79215.1 LysM peptidoglycan-binding domain-containing protein [Latilactobacillus graminis]
MKETRKQRIAAQKVSLHKQKREFRIKKVRNVTTFAGATVLMGSAIAPSFSNRAKATTEDVLDNSHTDPQNTATSKSENATTANSHSVAETATTSSAVNSSQAQATQQPVVQPQVTENEANKVATPQPAPTQAQPISGVQSRSANMATAGVVMTAASTSAQNFINSIASSAQQLAGDNDLYASVMIAQASLESGFGSSTLGKAPNYNLFGVKGTYNGNSAYMWTWEDDGHGNMYQIQAAFRKYPSYYQSLQDYVHVLRNTSFGTTPYYQGAFKSYTSSYQQATQYLQGRYATATNYAASLNRLIQQYNLTQYDTPGANAGSNGGTVAPTTPTAPQDGTKYTVKAGDSVWGIANQYGVSMSDLISWNHIKNNLIYPGQVLIVSSSATGNNNQTPTKPTPTPTPKPGNGEKYTVKAGDSVWAIANKYGISMNDLISWNNIKNNMIHPGDVLTVSKTATGNTNNNNNNSNSNNGNQTSNKTYTVKSGDSVWAISNRYGISMADLVQWNHIRNNFIYPGQKLVVSQGATTGNSNNNNTNSTNPGQTSGKTYTVKAGDSVWGIANRNGISMAQLIKANHIKNNFIYPGQVLKLTAGATTPTTPNTNSGKTYTVKSGDSLWSIAQKNNTSIAQLKSANNLHSDLILVGQVLKLK